MSIIHTGPIEPRNLEPLIVAGRDLLTGGQDLEAVLSYLREQGCHIGDCIDVTMALTGMQHRDAKRRVFQSETWRDLRPANERLHASVERALHQLAVEEPGTIAYRSGASVETSQSTQSPRAAGDAS
jgi:hypothetical protein